MTEQLQELDLTELSDTDRALFDKYTKGMVRVSSKEFYSTVGQKNVHPHIMYSKYYMKLGYFAVWKLCSCSERIVGAHIGGTTFVESAYFMRKGEQDE